MRFLSPLHHFLICGRIRERVQISRFEKQERNRRLIYLLSGPWALFRPNRRLVRLNSQSCSFPRTPIRFDFECLKFSAQGARIPQQIVYTVPVLDEMKFPLSFLPF